MRKLKLQMQVSADGFVAGPNGELDWMTWNWDENLAAYVINLTDSSDTILLGRKMTDGFVTHWTSVLDNPGSPEYSFAKKMVDTPKVVFTKTLQASTWANTELAKGEVASEIARLKNLPGKDIIVYGGASFVSSLIENRLIDELHLFVSPTAIGSGLRVFTGRTLLKLKASTAFECGIVMNQYEFTHFSN
jgi:dihydrofolate reductase